MKKKITKEGIFFTSIIFIIIFVDQILKIFINKANKINSSSTNIITNLIILVLVFRFLTSQNEFVNKKLKIFLSFIFAGGMSNLIDQIIRKQRIEYIYMFNLADIFVITGWICVIAIFTVFTTKELKNKKIESKKKE